MRLVRSPFEESQATSHIEHSGALFLRTIPLGSLCIIFDGCFPNCRWGRQSTLLRTHAICHVAFSTLSSPRLLRSVIHTNHCWHRLFERGAGCVGLDFLAHPFWDKYLEFKERLEAYDKMFAILGRIIHIPMHQYARYFEKYRQFASTQPLRQSCRQELSRNFEWTWRTKARVTKLVERKQRSNENCEYVSTPSTSRFSIERKPRLQSDGLTNPKTDDPFPCHRAR